MALTNDFKVKNGLTVIESISAGGNLSASEGFFDGDVGIGTNNPTGKLEIKASTNAGTIKFKQPNGSAPFVGSTVGTAMVFQTYGGVDKAAIYVDNSNNFTIGGADIHLDGVASGDRFKALTSGSLTAPSIQLDDTNGDETGLYLPATNQIGVITDRLERLRIDASGNVGIGTTSPAQKLHVVGNTTTTGVSYTDIVQTYSGSSIDFRHQDASVVMRVDTANARVGIGTTNPSSALHVAKDSGTSLSEVAHFVGGGSTDDKSQISIGGNTTSALVSFGFRNTGSGFGYISNASDVEVITIDGGNSRVGIGTPTPTAKLHISENSGQVRIGSPTTSYGGVGFAGSLTAANAALWGTATTTIIGAAGGGSIEMKLGNDAGGNGSLKMEADKLYYTGGNLGIGTTSPSQKLTVQGANNSSSATFKVQDTDSRGVLIESPYSGSGIGYIGTNGTNSALGFKINNVEKIRLDTSGNVGIGTTSPYAYDTTATKLHVKNAGSSGSISEVARLEGASDADGSGAILRIGTSNDRGIYLEGGRTGSVPYASIGTTEYNGAKTEGIRIASTGNVGIGTTSPSDKLEVYANGADVALRIHEDAGTHQARLHLRRGGSDWEIINDNNLTIESEGSEKMRITTTGNVGIGTTNPSAKLHVESTSTSPIRAYNGSHYAAIGANSNAAWIQAGGSPAHGLRLSAGANGAMSIYASRGVAIGEYPTTDPGADNFTVAGNVGIGTTSPSTKLHVTGNSLVTGNSTIYGNLSVTGDFTCLETTVSTTSALSVTNTGTGPALFVCQSGVQPVAHFIDANGGDVVIADDGKVGLGTFSPSSPLHICSNENVLARFHSTDANATLYLSDNGTSNFSTFKRISDNLAILENGGNVGIGTTSPGAKLDIHTATNTNGLLIREDTDDSITHNFYVDSSDNGVGVLYANGQSSKIQLNTAGNSYFNGGNVGIGTASPAGELEVQGTGDLLFLRETGREAVTITGQGNGSGSQMIFKTHSGSSLAEAMRILPSGNVGIGTTAPASKLHLQDTNGSIIILNSNTANENNGIFMTEAAAASPYTKGAYVHYDGTNESFKINTGDSTLSTRLTILRDSGNVGIGITNPSQKLHVNGNVDIDNGSILLQQAYGINLGVSGYDILMPSTTRVGIKTAGTERLSILNNGNVGIGTTAPDNKLTVSGAISATGNISTTGNILSAGVNIDQLFGSGGGGSFLPLAGGTMTGNINLNDDVKIRFGAAQDFELYHASSGDSYIINKTGILDIRNTVHGGDIKLQAENSSGTLEEYLRIDGGLGYIVSSKAIRIADGKALFLGDGDDLGIYHFASNNYIQNNLGDLIIQNDANDKDIIFKSDNGSGGIAEYLRIDGGTTTIQAYKDLLIANDTAKIKLGASQDLQIYHDGTNSVITNDTGNLIINNNTNDGDIIFKSDDGLGGVTPYLRLDGSHTQMLATKNLHFDDNVELRFGDYASPDLKIYHDGNNSKLSHTGSGGLYIGANLFGIQNGAHTETYIDATNNGAVNLYYDNSKKFETTTSGVSVTGSMVANAAVVNQVTAATSSGSIKFKNNSGSDKAIILDNGNFGIGTTTPSRKFEIHENTTNLTIGEKSGYTPSVYGPVIETNANAITLPRDLYLSSSQANVRNISGVLTLNGDNGIAFRYYDGSSGQEGMRLTNSGNVGINTTIPQEKLTVKGNIALSGASSSAGPHLKLEGTYTTWELENQYTGGATNDMFRIRNTATSSDALVINRLTNNVGIGTTTPSNVLHVKSTTLNNGAAVKIENTRDGGSDHGLQVVANGSSGSFATRIQQQGAGDILQVLDGSTEVFTILDGGNVGIGTTGPNALLNVQGDSDPTILINAVTGNSANSGKLAFAESGGGGLQAWMKYDGSANRLEIGTAQVSQAFVVNRTDGNVGIGCTTPTQKLAVDGDGLFTSNLTVQGSLSVTGAFTCLDTTISVTSAMDITNHGTGPALLVNQTGSNDIVNFQDDGTSAFYIEDGGYVGIGCTNPTQKLDVAGNINTSGEYVVDGGVVINQYKDFVGRNVDLGDNCCVLLGASDDLQIGHTGSQSTIHNDTGDLNIENDATDGDILLRSDDGSGGITNYLQIDGGGVLTRAYKNFRVQDDVYLQAGSSGDLEIVHASNHSYINNNTGDLYITNSTDDGDVILRSDNGSGGVTPYFCLDGSVADGSNVITRFPDQSILGFGSGSGFQDGLQIYHNATSSFINNYVGNLEISNNTTDGDIIFKSDNGSGGLTEYLTLDGGLGYTRSSQHLQMANGKALYLGNGNEMGIYHNGTDSYMENNTGDLIIRQLADDKAIRFQNDNGTGGYETYFELQGVSGGSSPFTVFPDDSNLVFGNGHDLRFYHNGSGSYVDNYTGVLQFTNYADDSDISFKSDDGSGGVAEYFRVDGSSAGGDGAGTLFTTFPDNSRAGFGNNADLRIYHDGTDSKVINSEGSLIISNNADDKDIYFQNDRGDGGTSTYFYLDGSLTNNSSICGATRFPDKSIIYMGTGGDLEIYHDGTNSVLNNKTGDLQIYNQTNDGDIQFISDDALGGVTEYFRLDGGDARMYASREIRFCDGVASKYGNAGDLGIYHDGSNSYIADTSGTGSLIVNTNAFLLKSANDGEYMMTAYEDGAVNLFHNNNPRFSTTSTGACVTGNLSVVGNVLLNDTRCAIFGSGQDLKIYHDGSHSYVQDSGTGVLKLLGSGVSIQNAAGSENMLVATENGSVGLYYDGNEKLQTSSTGITVCGDALISGHVCATTKSFVIDNPTTDGKLRYSVVEGNEHGVTVRGSTCSGTIELPDEWDWLVDEDSVTAQLTPVGGPHQPYVVSQDNKQVVVCSDGCYNYNIYGTRKDVEPLEVNM